MKRMRLGCLASGTGTNLQAIIDAAASGELQADVDRRDQQQLRLRRAPTHPESRHTRASTSAGLTHPDDRSARPGDSRYAARPRRGRGRARGLHEDAGTGRVVALRRTGVERASQRCCPSSAGRGCTAGRVHEAVLAAGESVTGATVHVVDAEYDHGPVVAQSEVPVLPDDTVGVAQRQGIGARARASRTDASEGRNRRDRPGRVWEPVDCRQTGFQSYSVQ